MSVLIVLVGCALAVSASAQTSSNDAADESKIAEVHGLRLQYMNCGGSGLALIFHQDFHHYFDESSDYYDPERPEGEGLLPELVGGRV